MTPEKREPEVEFLDYLIKAIVSHPEDVVITRTVDTMGVFLRLTVHPDDMGKVIGKGGKIADDAIRPLLSIIGMKNGSRVSFKIQEPVGGKKYSEVPELKSVDQVVDELGA